MLIWVKNLKIKIQKLNLIITNNKVLLRKISFPLNQ